MSGYCSAHRGLVEGLTIGAHARSAGSHLRFDAIMLWMSHLPSEGRPI